MAAAEKSPARKIGLSKPLHFSFLSSSNFMHKLFELSRLETTFAGRSAGHEAMTNFEKKKFDDDV